MNGFICKRCGEKFSEIAPYYEENNDFYCGDCAFILNKIDSKTLIKDFYYFINLDESLIGNPIVENNKVVFVSNSYFKAKENKQIRKTPEYIKWRNSIFKRDNFTCQICGQKGGTLNAHHIKDFANHKDLRTDTDNGITLCVKCHKNLHRRNKCKDI